MYLGTGIPKLFKTKTMATIYLETLIKADIHKVFDLARDIDLHQKSTSKTNEKAIAGRPD
ncbi:hypothetical protein CLA01_14800 [Chryseobacterium lathyri]|jgi:hypothetical protein|uniref:Uncharacterized protein n=1 Tax=Chryseobacterium lathyri TaxID=395933 RepID=A0A511Y899_9FLAO|nr:hypothetical protein CLA01_14800 [Chryseobacterium lathyri]